MKITLLIVGCIFMPFFYIGFAMAGMHTPIASMYRDIFEHYKSGEPFGEFDR